MNACVLAERLQLTRPLAFFDLESTGKYPDRDRIVEITIIVARPEGDEQRLSTLVNPTVSISDEVAAIHGITNAMVQDAPTFAELAPQIATFLTDCDLAGYNIRRFDVPLLTAEFARTRTPWSTDGRRIVDPQSIFFKREPRDLTAALRFYVGQELDGAHRAGADVEATIEVLAGQLERYEDLPTSVDALHDYCRDASWVDDSGKIVWSGAEACIGFGKNAGVTLRQLCASNDGRGYLRWLLNADFPADTKAIVTAALAGRFPVREQQAQTAHAGAF